MPGRGFSFFPLAISALCTAMFAQMAWVDHRYVLPLLLLIVLTFLPVFLARRRMRAILLRGNIGDVLGLWRPTIERVAHPETMAPLMIATAYAAYGYVDAARRALTHAAKGPAWNAAIEQRLLVETLLDTFEGERSAAIEKSSVLQQLPLPRASMLTRRRVVRIRQGLSAFARAFARQSQANDLRILKQAASASPLMHWAMRYAAAIVAVERHDKVLAHELLAEAPEWPKESAFQVFHGELESQVRAL